MKGFQDGPDLPPCLTRAELELVVGGALQDDPDPATMRLNDAHLPPNKRSEDDG